VPQRSHDSETLNKCREAIIDERNPVDA